MAIEYNVFCSKNDEGSEEDEEEDNEIKKKKRRMRRGEGRTEVMWWRLCGLEISSLWV